MNQVIPDFIERATAKTLCLMLSLCLAACDSSEDDRSPLVGELETTLQPVSLELPFAVLSLWSDGEQVWFAGGGGDADDGRILRLEGDAIREEVTPRGPTLWWIAGADAEQLYAVGDAGRILRRHSGEWRAEESNLGDLSILYGVWSASPTEIWAVGGSVRRGGPKAVVLRSNGDGIWRREASSVFPEDLNFYKVWGRGADDVFIVGEGGLVIHWNGEVYKRVAADGRSLYFTVHGNDSSAVAVGGLEAAAVSMGDSAGWKDITPDNLPALNGVYVRGDDQIVAVGNRGVVGVRTGAGRWDRLKLPYQTELGSRTLHAVWSESVTWAVGGDLSAMNNGIILSNQRPMPRLELSE